MRRECYEAGYKAGLDKAEGYKASLDEQAIKQATQNGYAKSSEKFIQDRMGLQATIDNLHKSIQELHQANFEHQMRANRCQLESVEKDKRIAELEVEIIGLDAKRQ